MTFDPDQCGIAARRLASQMVADQKVPIMMSYVGLGGDLDEASRRIVEGEAAVVVVARGEGAVRVMMFIDRDAPPKHSEIVKPLRNMLVVDRSEHADLIEAVRGIVSVIPPADGHHVIVDIMLWSRLVQAARDAGVLR